MIDVLGYIALCFGVGSYFFKEDKYFKSCQIMCSLFFTFHFYLLESWMGAISVGLGFVSLLLSMTLKSNKLNYSFFAIYVGLFIYGLFQFESATWYEIMPLLSNIFWAIAMLFMSGQKTNIGLIFVIACWVVYAIAVNSMPNLMTQIVIFFVLLYRMFLLRNESKKIAIN